MPTAVPTAVPAGRFRASTTPARATRIGSVPQPRLRPLAEVLAELVRPAAAPPAHLVEPLPARPPAEAPPSEAGRTRAVVLRLLQAVVEVLDGVRPAAHLQRVCDEAAHAGVTAAARAAAGRSPRGHRSRLRGVRVCPVAPDAVEVAAAVHRDGRARALAARLEHDGRDWRFTLVALL